MKAISLLAQISFALATDSPAQISREVVWDSSGRIVQTIDHQKQAGGNERAVICDASGRITATTQASGSTAQARYRDANGRSAGSASMQGSGDMGIWKVCNCRASQVDNTLKASSESSVNGILEVN